MTDKLNLLTGTYGSGNPYSGGVRRMITLRKPKPSGSKQCTCGRKISANKKSCLDCSSIKK